MSKIHNKNDKFHGDLWQLAGLNVCVNHNQKIYFKIIQRNGAFRQISVDK